MRAAMHAPTRSLVVLERGSRLPDLFPFHDSVENVVIAQHHDESHDDLVARTAERLAAHARKTEPPSLVVMACNADAGDAAARARARLLDLLVGCLAPEPQSRLLLTAAAPRASSALWTQLVLLAETALSLLGPRRGTVSIRFA